MRFPSLRLSGRWLICYLLSQQRLLSYGQPFVYTKQTLFKNLLGARLVERMMPSKTPKQKRFMAAVAHNPKFAKKVGVHVSVGEEFNAADKKRKSRKGAK